MVVKNFAIIQARLDSTRFPGKILEKIGKYYVIEFLIKRLKFSNKIDQIFLATPDKNKVLKKIAKKNKIKIFIGNENNVLKRFYQCAKINKFKNSDNIIRVTGDCPFVDPKYIDIAIQIINEKKYDLVSNTNPPTFPDGLDFSVFKFSVLKEIYIKSRSKSDQEHVTSYIYKKKRFKKYNIKYKKNCSNIRLTIDFREDLNFLKILYKELNKINFNIDDLFKALNKLKKIKIYKNFFNSGHQRNIGSVMSTGYKMWKRAENIIPGGNMLLSKRPDNFLPLKWPTYFIKSKGCFIWDLENKKYLDICMMGVGTNILGYANKKVDNEVKKIINNGIVSTLNSPVDLQLAEILLKQNSWASMVKYARSGGEVLAIAVRIARAYTKKNIVLFCGYHGWHDWYLSANLGNKKNLDKHLISNLKISGVPSILKNSSIPFEYNNIKYFNKIFKKNKKNISAIIMEVERNQKLKVNFLKHIRKFSKKNNIPLIFDECTTGFRETASGLYKKYSIEPDMVMYGKSIANGYAFSAILGRKEIMSHATNTFISSTSWSEAVGPTAAIATLKEMQRTKSWIKISKLGNFVKKNWKRIALKNNIKLKVYGIDAIPKFEIKSKNFLKYKTYITQEMLKKNILANNIIYISISHTRQVLKKYLKQLDDIFKTISKCEKNILNINELIDGRIAKEEFKKK